MRNLVAFAALVVASVSPGTFGWNRAEAQVGPTPCMVAAERIAREHNGDNPVDPRDRYYERAYSECVNNGDNPFTELPTGNLETLCNRVKCQAAY